MTKEYRRWASRLDASPDRFTAVFWLNVPVDFHWVLSWPMGRELGFTLHHATKDRVMFVKPHSAGNLDQVPSYGTHYVKVECIVVEDGTGNVLMVRERIGADSLFKNISGSVEAGEFVADAAVREVLEESGVLARFGCVLGHGNRLRTRFDRDEIIVGCLLFAAQGQPPHPDGREVSEATWFVPRDVMASCTPMCREWMVAADMCNPTSGMRKHVNDIYRGAPHSMDFFMP